MDVMGIGIAPIGHSITVDTVEEVNINIKTQITFDENYSFENLKQSIINIISDYLLEIRKDWGNQNTSVIRIAQIESKILSIDGVVDIINTKINERLVKYNFSSRRGTPIKYIVIHDTGNIRKGADANAHFTLFNRENRGASAHYFVDDKQILRIIREEDKSWHCGDEYGKYGVTNENSIGIEMCINPDSDFNKTYISTIHLTRYLMKKYNIPIDNVVRHYDASRKLCPDIWKSNNWEKWYKFKDDLKKLDLENCKDYTKTIKLLYKNVLQREADSGGINYYNEKLNIGASWGDVLKEMGDSEEFKSKYIHRLIIEGVYLLRGMPFFSVF